MSALCRDSVADPPYRAKELVFHGSQSAHVTDSDTGETIVLCGESGGKPYGDPIPTGEFEILDHPDKNFFRLNPVDVVHSAYARNTHVVIPTLENFERMISILTVVAALPESPQAKPVDLTAV